MLSWSLPRNNFLYYRCDIVLARVGPFGLRLGADIDAYAQSNSWDDRFADGLSGQAALDSVSIHRKRAGGPYLKVTVLELKKS